MGAVFFIETKSEEKSQLLCQIAEYFYELKNTIQIICESQAKAIKSNALLWTFSNNSFVPHQVVQLETQKIINEMVVITPGLVQLNTFENVIFENGFHFDFVNFYLRLIHFVETDDQNKLKESRELWKYLRQNNISAYHSAYRSDIEFENAVKIFNL